MKLGKTQFTTAIKGDDRKQVFLKLKQNTGK